MHIAFYSPALSGTGYANGIVTYVGHMRDALEVLGHQVTIVTADHIKRADGSVQALRKLPWILFT